MDFSNYRFRSSALGKIISKSGKLTDTNKTYLNELFIGETYGIQKEITSKYFEKGIICEQDGRDFLKRALYPRSFIPKNRVRIHNEYIHGEPDVVMQDYHYDIKNAYDLFTFGKAQLTHDYEWQVKGYTMLLDEKPGRLLYIIADMSDVLLADEEKKLFYQGKFLTMESEAYQQACEELRKKYSYSHIPLEERFKLFEVPYTEQDRVTIIKSVEMARSYLQSLQDEREQLISHNKTLIQNASSTNNIRANAANAA